MLLADLQITDNHKTYAILTKDKSVVRIGLDCPVDKRNKFLRVLNNLAVRIQKDRTVYAHIHFTGGRIRITFSTSETGPQVNDVTYIQDF